MHAMQQVKRNGKRKGNSLSLSLSLSPLCCLSNKSRRADFWADATATMPYLYMCGPGGIGFAAYDRRVMLVAMRCATKLSNSKVFVPWESRTIE